MPQQPEPATTYTGPTDPYGAPRSTFPGPYAVDAKIYDITSRELAPLGPDGPRRTATVLLVERRHRATWPSLVRATVDGPADRWAVHPDYEPYRAPARAIADALSAAGIPARASSTGHRIYAAVVELEPAADGPRWLSIGSDEGLVWTLDGIEGSLAGGEWASADPADAPAHVRRWLGETGARLRRQRSQP